MKNLMEVREFDTIVCDEHYIDSPYFKYLDEKHFKELEQFIKEYSSEETDILEFMSIGFKRSVGTTITFHQYVGIIELQSGFQIEVLPKVTVNDDEGDFAITKRIFLNMLCCLKEFEGKSFHSASLNADRMNLYEIFINMYLQETRKLVKHGIKSAYIQKEDNLKFYKGKLMISRHIRTNAAHKERFYMQYDEYHVNRPENRLIKSTLLKLQKLTDSMENAKEVRQLLHLFELVDPSINIDKDFASVHVGRDMKHYEKVLQWTDIFLRNKSFTTFSGKKTGTALLFPMEQVFEAFVAKWVSRIFTDASNGTVRVTAQDRGYYLFDSPRKFRLRPDIVLRKAQENAIILDTKWKCLKPDARINYGISQADMYQMYAYAKKYHTSEIWLIYPYYENVKGIAPLCFTADEGENQKVTVRVFFVDLADYRNSIQYLYDTIFPKE
jgi:5-methylcytosine-specific restriction enzyme subunit McrC